MSEREERRGEQRSVCVCALHRQAQRVFATNNKMFTDAYARTYIHTHAHLHTYRKRQAGRRACLGKLLSAAISLPWNPLAQQQQQQQLTLSFILTLMLSLPTHTRMAVQRQSLCSLFALYAVACFNSLISIRSCQFALFQLQRAQRALSHSHSPFFCSYYSVWALGSFVYF